jgi:hypothetical protein
MRARRAAVVAAAVVLAGAGAAAADPVFEPPVMGKARRGGEQGAPLWGFFAEARLVGVLGADRLAVYPDRGLGLEVREPAAAAVRAGGVVWLAGGEVGVVLQADLAETVRPPLGGERLWSREPGAFVGALVDDLYLLWRPARALELVVGRHRVAVSRYRMWDERDLPLGVPFVIDRVMPDRRLGVTMHGDFGAFAYALGAWEDLDALEPRGGVGEDPSLGGRLAAGGHLEWTPIAPMYGSNPVGAVVGARGPLPTPRKDPWYATHRLSMGLGVLARMDDDGVVRTDVSFGAGWKWRWLAADAEAVLELGTSDLGGWAEVHATPVDKVSLGVRGEWDPAAGGAGHAAGTAGGGVMWHASEDRRSRIGVWGWVRQRESATGVDVREDAVIVLVQTAI